MTVGAGRPGYRAWQRMLSGRRLDIIDPSALDVEIEDIALGLSRIARWNGQTIGEHGYSVAQHSILVAELVAVEDPGIPTATLLAALLHDAPEYVTSDLVTPLKRAIGDGYQVIEEKVGRAIRQAFGLPATLPPEWQDAIGSADRLSAFIEAVRLAGFSEAEARTVFGVRRRKIPDLQLDPWSAQVARGAFLAVFADLMAGGTRCRRRWTGQNRPRNGRGFGDRREQPTKDNLWEFSSLSS